MPLSSFGMSNDAAGVKKMAEQGLEPINAAISSYLRMFQGGMSGMPSIPGMNGVPGGGAGELGTKMLSYAGRNMTTAFTFVQSLMEARDIRQVLELQTEFVQSQMHAMTEQISDLGRTAMTAMADSAKPAGKSS
ncbi:MAG: phasin family protein [Rhodoplanes sp.]|uniref:phasin family protein n=1 Tax=Rhodoplanes sp. TaxID=1968906 RepID=UPI0017E74DD2|nr:phasin family protein [Rhodoplanes sp.]NVO16556.1 phasin family protein [Rhodoplanes sp.]